MNIILAEHFGMCFGVRDAIAEAEQLAEQGPLTILSASSSIILSFAIVSANAGFTKRGRKISRARRRGR